MGPLKRVPKSLASAGSLVPTLLLIVREPPLPCRLSAGLVSLMPSTPCGVRPRALRSVTPAAGPFGGRHRGWSPTIEGEFSWLPSLT